MRIGVISTTHGELRGGILKSTALGGSPDKLSSTILVCCFAIVQSMKVTNLGGSQSPHSMYQSQDTLRFPIRSSNQFGWTRRVSVIDQKQTSLLMEGTDQFF